VARENKMKFLITGGAGFLGSHLCKKLLTNNNEIICLDNFQTGNIENISELIENKNFHLMNHDLREKIIINNNIDFIYNLACPASPKKYQADPIGTIQTCTVGMFNILDLALEKNADVLHTSTSEIYGDPLQHPQVEDYFGNVNPFGPRSCYDEGKRCAETIIYEYINQKKLSAKIVRIFNTFGPNMDIDDGRVVSNFIVQALRGEDLTIYGDGSQTRSLCYVDDLLEGFESFRKIGKSSIGPVNLGNSNEISIKELAEVIIDQTNSKSGIIYKDLPENDPKVRKPNTEKAKKLFSFEPKYSLNDGLKNTISYFQNKI
tara:strand:+ start:3089 stop:4042 length:954 start_codon:yes stop_codon:yes gene_type:complete